MSSIEMHAPIGLLQAEKLTAADKLVWMIMRLDRKNKTVKRLAELTGLSRCTIYNAINRLEAAGWYVKSGDKPKAIVNRYANLDGWVTMTAELLTSKLKPRDIVMYGLLKDKNYQRKLDGKFTYRGLADYSRRCVKTVRRAVKTLKMADWLNTWQKRKSQMAPYEFSLDSPSAKFCREQIELTNMRLKRPYGHGEAIALALVKLVAEPSECWANARPEWLVNPDTGEWMELDIWLPEYKLAVEFNGQQHYQATPFASAEDVAKQQKRDAIKAEILRKRGYKPVVLTAADLSVAAVIKKLRGLVPLRDLRWYKRLVDYLNYVGRCYQRKAQQMVAQGT